MSEGQQRKPMSKERRLEIATLLKKASRTGPDWDRQHDPSPWDVQGFFAESHKNTADLLAEVDRQGDEIEKLRAALQGVLDVCRDRHAFMMMGPRAFARAEQIAKKALESGDSGHE